MPKLNPYLIKENYKQVEEVREIENKELITPEEREKIVEKLVKNEIPSYEEFMKTYEEDEEAIDNYYYEIDSYGDVGIDKGYGPVLTADFDGRSPSSHGRSRMTDEDHEDTKLAVGTTLTIASFVFPPSAVVGLTTFFGASGAAMYVAGKANNDSELTKSGKSFLVPVAEKAGEGIAKTIFKK